MKREFYFKSSSNKDIYQLMYVPSKVKGYVQIVTDMYDYIGRYESIMSQLSENGFLVFGIDFPGHGKNSQDSLGNMAGYGYEDLLTDVHNSYVEALKLYPPDFAPVTVKNKDGKTAQLLKPQLHAMVGIGFGCSLIRSYCTRYNDVNSLVFVGDYGLSSRYEKILKECRKLQTKNGDDASSQEIREKLEENYNKYFKDTKLYRNSYRCTDLRDVRAINKDEFCNFEYTLQSMTLMLSVLSQFTMSQWMNIFPRYMPLYELAGYDDPISNYTREIDDILKKFKYTNANNIFHKYYENARHDVLFEKSGPKVVGDIKLFLNQVLNSMNAVYNQSLKEINS